MKIVIIGGTGLVGSKLAKVLRARGHDVLAAAPNTGVNTLTGEGLDDALAGANVVVDVSNSPSYPRTRSIDFNSSSAESRSINRSGRKNHCTLPCPSMTNVVGALVSLPSRPAPL